MKDECIGEAPQEASQMELTAEQIDAMEAGPEMDALVAVRVMGWKWLQDPTRDCNTLIPPWEQVLILPQYLAKCLAWEDRQPDAPPYSTDWGGAGEVADKLRVDGWIVLGEGDSTGWMWCIQESVDFHETPDAIAVSAEDVDAKLAICRAALKTTLK